MLMRSVQVLAQLAVDFLDLDVLEADLVALVLNGIVGLGHPC